MKKIALFFVLFLGISAAFAQEPNGVVAYFKLLPQDIRVYELQEKNGKYISQDPTTEAKLNPVVDTKNGYIEISSEGTGGGQHEIRVVLYRKANKDALIAVSEKTDDGTTEDFKLRFFAYQNKKYTDVTEQVFPKISHKDFLKNNMDLKKYQSILDYSPICVELPRLGTVAKMRVSQRLINFKCSTTGDTDNKLACELKNKFFAEVELIWDKASGKFSVGNKK